MTRGPAQVQIQNVQMVPEMLLRTAHRAVCKDHPYVDFLIPPWMGDTHLIEAGSASWYNAELDAKIHNVEKHGISIYEDDL